MKQFLRRNLLTGKENNNNAYFHRFVGNDNRPESDFLGVQQMEAGTANNVIQALKDLLQLQGLNVINLVRLATNGAVHLCVAM